jgi:hypothetical protein
MTLHPLALTLLLFALLLAVATILFLRSLLRRRVGVLPSWRVLDHAIVCQDCGHVAQQGRRPAARYVCGLCKTDSYYL